MGFENVTIRKNRERWNSKSEFLLACIGYAVGLGNIWRFPYLCYKSGGGAFLFPYFIMLIFCGIPLLYMEMAIGQLTRLGPFHSLAKLCPLLKGVGIAMVVISFILCTYYNMIIAWALHFFFNSFSNPLPWTSCNNTWNTIYCMDDGQEIPANSVSMNLTTSDQFNYSSAVEKHFPSFEYFNNEVLQITDGIEHMGNMRWNLFGYLLLAWFICYCCLFKGIKSVGKVVYVTAIFPYAILLVLLVRAATLPGAYNGVMYFIYPDWSKLLDAEIWMYAAVQNFNSIGIGFGSLIAFSSYNPRNNNIMLDTFTIAIINSITSLLAGFVIFSALGYISSVLGVSVSDAVRAGPELVFVVFPTIFSHLPVSSLWSALFFIMLIFLGIDSQFAMVEVVLTSLMDQFQGKLKKYSIRKELVVLIVCLSCFILGLPNLMQGGMYFFNLIDNYCAITSLMFIAYFEVMAVCWCYGGNRLAKQIGLYSGFRPPWFFPFCWIFITPALITFILNFTFIQYQGVTYGEYEYPAWSHFVGWLITLSSIIWIPVCAVETLINCKGTLKQRFFQSITPTLETRYSKLMSNMPRNQIPMQSVSQSLPMEATAPRYNNTDERAPMYVIESGLNGSNRNGELQPFINEDV